MKANDAVIGVIVLLFGSAVALYSQTFPILGGMPVGPGLFPTIIGLGMAVCGVILIGRAFIASRFGQGAALITLEGWARDPASLLRAAAVIVALIFYLFASQALGFHVTSAIIVSGLMMVFAVRPIAAIPMGAITAIVIHYIFYSLLRVPLPWGVLLPVAW